MKGYFLPQIPVQEVRREINGVMLELPSLSPSQIGQISEGLIQSHEKLIGQSILKIVDLIDMAARRWLNRKDPIRLEAESTLPVLTGASKEMITVGLDDLFKDLTRPVLIQLLEEELGDPILLDHFRPKLKGSGFTRAFGPRLITHVLPGNVGGTAVMSLACGLLAKSSNLAKVSTEELLLPVLFAESLYEIAPDLARNLAVMTWDNQAVEITQAAFEKADLVIAYGNDETIEKVRERVPATTRAIYHGHKLSLGVIAREVIHPSLSEQAAMDISLYDQRGCLSPHVYYVEEGGAASPLEFAQWLAQSLYVASYQLPKGPTSTAEAAQIQQLRGSLPLKGGKVLPSPKGLDWTVLYDPAPHFSLSPLARTIWIKPVADLTEIPGHLEPVRGFLQAVGMAVPVNRQPQIVPFLAQMGANRICPIGKMQKPPMTWHQDGRFRLLNLLRFVDWENP
jgi:hypothetical protein